MSVWVAGSDTVRVGLIGCGGRGTGAAFDAANSSDGVEIVAMADLFRDRLESSRENMKELGAKVRVTDDMCFHGWKAYQQLLATDVNYVILATPPGFRPIHLRAAVEAGKNIFMEKPVAVCPTGIRSVMESADMAKQKGLAIVAGTQRRHHKAYLEIIKRIHDGAIGDLVAGECYWTQGGLWSHPREPEWTSLEWQIRNWLYFTWLSGDHICEQHIHNIDVMNWCMGSHPVRAVGSGGRQSRVEAVFGQIYDHFSIEFEYPNGARVQSRCRQVDNCASRVSEHVVGTKGYSDPGGWIEGAAPFKFQGEAAPYVQEHADNIAAIRAGKPLNEGRQVAESTLCAIMGRMAAYTGQEVTWDFALNKSKLNLMKDLDEFGPMDVDAVAVPGVTPLI